MAHVAMPAGVLICLQPSPPAINSDYGEAGVAEPRTLTMALALLRARALRELLHRFSPCR